MESLKLIINVIGLSNILIGIIGIVLVLIISIRNVRFKISALSFTIFFGSYFLVLMVLFLAKMSVPFLQFVTQGYIAITLGICLAPIFFKDEDIKEQNASKYIDKLYMNISTITIIIVILVYLPFLAQYLSIKYKNNNIKPETWMSFYATFFGIIASISGIYWQVTRTERKEKERNQVEKINNLNSVYNLYKYMIKKNFEEFDNEFTKDIFLQKLYSTRRVINNNWFFVLDDEILKQDMKLILSQENGYDLVELHNDIKSFNKSVNKFKHLVKTDKIKKMCFEIAELDDDVKKIHEFLINEIEIIEILMTFGYKVNNKKLNRSIEYLEKNIEEIEFLHYRKKYVTNYEIDYKTKSKFLNISDRIGFIQEVIQYLQDLKIIDKHNVNLNNVFCEISNYGLNFFIIENAFEKIIKKFNEVYEELQLNKQQDS